jgi:hypothetical protein
VSILDFEIVGDSAGVERLLGHLHSSLSASAMTNFLNTKIGPYLQQRAKARFRGEGDDVVGGWAPLSEATMSFRRAGRERQLWSVGDAHPINVRTGELENYITGGFDPAYPTTLGATLLFPHRSNKGGKKIREKMTMAQKGSERGPARPVLGVNERDATFVLVELAFHVQSHQSGF